MEFRMMHVNLHVADLARSMAFYEKALGLTEKRRITAPDGSFALVFIGGPSGGCEIELTWIRGREGGYDLGENENHIGFSVPNIEEAHKLHEEMDVITRENEGMGIYFICDPDDYELEIIPLR